MRAQLFTTKNKGKVGANIIIEDKAICQIVKHADNDFRIYGLPSTSNFIESNKDLEDELLGAYKSILDVNALAKKEAEEKRAQELQSLLDSVNTIDDLISVYELGHDCTSDNFVHIDLSIYDEIKYILDNKHILKDDGSGDVEFVEKVYYHNRGIQYNRIYDHAEFIKNAEQYFDANYDLLLREDLVDTLKEQIANMDDMDDITTLVKKYDEHEDGYYCDGIDGEQKMTLSRLGELTYYNGEKKSIWFGIRF